MLILGIFVHSQHTYINLIIAYNFIRMTKNNIWPMNLNGLRESKVKFKIAIEKTVCNYVPIQLTNLKLR